MKVSEASSENPEESRPFHWGRRCAFTIILTRTLWNPYYPNARNFIEEAHHGTGSRHQVEGQTKW